MALPSDVDHCVSSRFIILCGGANSEMMWTQTSSLCVQAATNTFIIDVPLRCRHV